MSGPEKLIKTLHKRKVALQNQYYRVHCHHRHRHHRRHPHHHHQQQDQQQHHHHHPIRRPCTSADGADWQSLEKPTMNTLSLMTMWDLYQHYFQIDMVQLSHQVSIKSLKHDKHFWELFTSKEEFRVSIIQVGRYLLFFCSQRSTITKRKFSQNVCQALVAHNYGIKVEPFFEVGVS